MISVAVTAVVILGSYMALTFPQWMIPYEPENFSVAVEDGQVCVYYTGEGRINCSYGYDGEDEFFLYFTQNPWSAYIEPLLEDAEKEEPYRYQIDSVERISKVKERNLNIACAPRKFCEGRQNPVMHTLSGEACPPEGNVLRYAL